MSLKLKKQIFAEKNLEVGLSNENMGNLYVQFGKNENAIDFFISALQIYQSQFGYENVILSKVMHAIGNCYWRLG